MSEHVKLKRQKLLLLALKTAIGGSAAKMCIRDRHCRARDF